MTQSGRRVSIPPRVAPTDRAPPSDDDRTLVLRLAAGDESALGELYGRLAGRVHAIASSILDDPHEAEDVVEETFYQAWRSAARFDGRRAAVSTWLIMIARSRALDRLRARRRMAGSLAAARLTAELAGDSVRGGAEVSGAQAERIGRADLLAAELAALPAEQRALVELAFFHGLTHAEMAARTGLPLGTVKTRIRLAMQKLRERLGSFARRDG